MDTNQLNSGCQHSVSKNILLISWGLRYSARESQPGAVWDSQPEGVWDGQPGAVWDGQPGAVWDTQFESRVQFTLSEQQLQ